MVSSGVDQATPGQTGKIAEMPQGLVFTIRVVSKNSPDDAQVQLRE